MGKLRKKVFWAIYGSLSAATFIGVLLYNASNYFSTRNMLQDAARSVFVDPRYSEFIIRGFVNNLLFSVILLICVVLILYFIVKDITNWIVKPAEDSFKKQQDFIADASHELKTPLSVIVTSAEAINQTAKNKQNIENIKEESSRMSVLITKLLDLATSEKTNEAYLQAGNLSKTIELTTLVFEAKALEKNCKMKLNIQENIERMFNEIDIKQLCEILLDNALEHAKPKSTIEIFLTQEGKEIIFEVINVGDPIPAGDDEKIFERFYRSDKVRNPKNNRYGLGLAIAKNIVINHNGQISARSSKGKTFFKVIL